MALGMTGKFDILQQSPYDFVAPAESAASSVPVRWTPSRYNIRATADDGRLVLWNTLSGKMTVFASEDREAILKLLRRSGIETEKEGAIEYLVDRGYLVHEGVDEFRQFQRLFGRQHYRSDALELILMASEDCNFRCEYCYEDFARGTMEPAVREGVKNLVRKQIQKLNRLYISWFGGEPLYGWAAIEDLAPFFVEMASEHEVPFSSHMTTNGYLLTPDIVDRLFDWKIRDFQITLDGLPEHHNQSRVGRDGSPTFDRIFNNLKEMARRADAFHVMLRVNVAPVNASGLSKFVDLLAAEFKEDRRFHPALKMVGRWGGANDSQLDVCGGDDAATIQRDIMAQAKQQGLRLGSLRDVARMGGQVCYAARPYNFLIGASGKVMKCTIVLDKSDDNVVGELSPDGSLKLNEERMALWTEPAFEQDGQCRKCVVLPSCQGISCPLIRMRHNTQPCVPTRSNPKGELLATLEDPSFRVRQVPL